MSTLQQGYLQYIPAGSDQAQKVFVNITPQEIAIYPEDPAKLGQSVPPISRFNLQKIQLVDSGDFQRPKSFGVLTERGNLIEFSCPTNSVRSAWIKSIGDVTSGSANPQPASLKVPGNSTQPAMDVYRTPVNSYKMPQSNNGGNTSNRFSDFDGFANQALSQLNSLKAVGGPVTIAAVPRAPQSGTSFANPTRLNPAARVVKPSISRGVAPPPPPSQNYSTPVLPTQPAPLLVAPQPAIRKTPVARSNNNVASQQPNKPLPKWLPGHYKATTLVNNPKNPSPQRARNVYSQNPPQQASTLLGRSLSAPGYNANVNHTSEPQQQQFYRSEPSGFSAQQSQYHHHQQQPYTQHQTTQPQQGLPLEKMTLEQLRSAFMNMPTEIRSAIIGPNDPSGNPASQPGSRKPSAHREREYNSDSDEDHGRRETERNQRNSRAESNNRRNRERDSQRSDEEEYYRNKSRQESRERAESERNDRERERSRSRQKTRDYSSESNDSYEKRPRRRSSRSKYQTESNDEYYREDHGEIDRRFSNSARALAYDEEEEERFELPPKTNYERHSLPSRLDYADDIEQEADGYEETGLLRPHDLEFSDFQRKRPTGVDESLPRYMRSKEKEKTQPEKERNNRSSSNPKGTKTKPPLERSRSAPPTSTATRDFTSKTKSSVPRGDLLEWSKKQAWQKHVSNGFPMSKAQEKAKEIYKSMSQGVKSKDMRETRLSADVNRPAQAEPVGRSSTQRMKALEDNMARSNLGVPSKPTPTTPGSFFNFMKSRGAPVPAGLKNISQGREQSRNGGNFNENQRRESLAQQEDKIQTRRHKMNFPSPEQISSGLNHPEKQFPSSSRAPTQKNSNLQHPHVQHQSTKQGVKKNSSPPEKQMKKNSDYVSFDQLNRTQAPVSNKLQQHRHSHDDASTISASTQSVLRSERPQSQQNMFQSNSSTPLTDVAEWQRVTNWLTSIRMERYIPTFREHGITKLSLIELLTGEAFWELGIDPNDIPVIKQKVAEFSARIKTFSEEGALFTSITATQRLQKGKITTVDEDVDEEDKKHDAESVLRAVDLWKKDPNKEVLKTKKFLPIADIQTFQIDFLEAFDHGRYPSFIEMWERFLHYYLPSSSQTHIQTASEEVNFTQQQRPALFYAKQAMEFHLFVYFYVYSIRKSLSKEEISVTRRALKEYLEGLATQYETFHPLLEEKVFALGQPHTNSTITTTTENNYPHSSSAVIEESVGLPVSAVASSLNETQTDLGPETPPKPLITSREFATFAGLVFVPNPQYNPAFQTLFTDDWAQALRHRLIQFVAILIEEFEKIRAKNPLIALSEAPLIQSEREKPKLAPLKMAKEPLSLARPSEIDQRKTFEEEIVQQSEEGVGKLLLETAEISPIYPSGPSDRNELPLTDRFVASEHQQHRVHNILPPVSSLLQQSEHYHSFERPVESPQSNCSTISQLTDDTPLKSDPHRHSIHKSGQKPSLAAAVDPAALTAPAFTFGKTSSSALADAANRANVRLKNLQSQSNGVSAPNAAPVIAVLGASVPIGTGNTVKPRISPSPPKSSLQMQVDNYNKLLKQNRMSKTSQPSTSLASSSLEIQQQTNNLLQEMHLPANKDLLNQIDAIIAPINHPVAPSTSSTNPPNNTHQPQATPSNRGFNLGVSIPRPVSVQSNSLSIPALDNTALADQVNRYKSLLKGPSKAASVSSTEERRDSNTSVSREAEGRKEVSAPVNLETLEKVSEGIKTIDQKVTIISEEPPAHEDESLPESENSFPTSENEESFPESVQEIAELVNSELQDKEVEEKEETLIEGDITLKQVTETEVEGTDFSLEQKDHNSDLQATKEDIQQVRNDEMIDVVVDMNVEKEEGDHNLANTEKIEQVDVEEQGKPDHKFDVLEKAKEEFAENEAQKDEVLDEDKDKKDEMLAAPTAVDNAISKEDCDENQLPLVDVSSVHDLKPSEQEQSSLNDPEEQRHEEKNIIEKTEAETTTTTDKVEEKISNFSSPSIITDEPLSKDGEVVEEKVERSENVEAEESFLVEDDAPDVEETNVNTTNNPTKSNKKKKKRRKSTLK